MNNADCPSRNARLITNQATSQHWNYHHLLGATEGTGAGWHQQLRLTLEPDPWGAGVPLSAAHIHLSSRLPAWGRFPQGKAVRDTASQGRPLPKAPRGGCSERYLPGNSHTASALPREVKQASASQQEISNHFSDTKATGIRCRSEDEGLQQAEKWACACWCATRASRGGLLHKSAFQRKNKPLEQCFQGAYWPWKPGRCKAEEEAEKDGLQCHVFPCEQAPCSAASWPGDMPPTQATAGPSLRGQPQFPQVAAMPAPRAVPCITSMGLWGACPGQ